MRSSIATAVLGLGATAYAAVQQQCQGSICYSLSIPDATASSGSGDIYMQIKGPTSYSWIGLGQGDSMAGAQIFVIYTSADGKNVTLSPRIATSQSQPQYNSNAQVSLLEGSGVSNGVMTANIKCSSCQSWSGGSMDFSSSSTSWIYAVNSGSSLNTDSTSANIQQHQNTYGSFSFGASAKGGSSTNPFLASSASTGSTGSSGSSGKSCTRSASTAGSSGTATAGSNTVNAASTTVPFWAGFTGRPTSRPTGITGPYFKRATSDDDCEDETGSGNDSNGGSLNTLATFQSPTVVRQKNMLIAHGVLASLAFVIIFPLGAIGIKLLSIPHIAIVHGMVQALALVLFIVAFGLGVTIANEKHYIGKYHPVIGIILFCLLIIQPILGALHHAAYKKYQSRTYWSYLHLWLGRSIITLGIINGGLGFLLANNTTWGPIVYGIVAGIMYIVYLASIFVGERRRNKHFMPPKYSETVPSAENSPPRSRHHEFYGGAK